MTKLIAVLAILAALAWAATATASWITKKKSAMALPVGRSQAQQGPVPLTDSDLNKAMLRAQLHTVAGVVFSLVILLALLRVSIGLAGQAALPLALMAGLSASGGLLLFSALPAAKLPVGLPLLKKRHFILPGAILLAYLAFLVVSTVAPAGTATSTTATSGWAGVAPLALAVVMLTGTALLALRRLSKTASLPDPRMRSIDRRWRELSARHLVTFTSGALLTYLGGTAAFTGKSLLASSPNWGIACLTVGILLGLAGVVLLLLAAKGALTIRAASKSAPITA
ncbi:hypothetical protein [Arthrobacter psychrolactophilus]